MYQNICKTGPYFYLKVNKLTGAFKSIFISLTNNMHVYLYSEFAIFVSKCMVTHFCSEFVITNGRFFLRLQDIRSKYSIKYVVLRTKKKKNSSSHCHFAFKTTIKCIPMEFLQFFK